MKQVIATKKAPAAVGPYSQAIATKKTVYCSGQIPLVPETGLLVEGDIVAQTHQVFANIKAVLEEANLGLKNVIKATVFMTNLEDFTAFNEIYAQYFTKPYPARSCVQVAALPKGAQVEIEVIAKPEPKS